MEQEMEQNRTQKEQAESTSKSKKSLAFPLFLEVNLYLVQKHNENTS